MKSCGCLDSCIKDYMGNSSQKYIETYMGQESTNIYVYLCKGINKLLEYI